MKKSVFSASRHVKDAYLRYLKTAYGFADENLQAKFDLLLQDATTVTKGPYITLGREYAEGRSLADLVRAGVLHPDLLKLDWRFDTNRPLYVHQDKAVCTAADRRHFLVTTGTGSGKTECFLIPVLDWCLKHRGKGLKAVIIYPMNALANDQKDRIDALKLEERTGLKCNIYTSQTSEAERKQAREADIVITNYKQMEFLLIRKIDREMFGENLRFLVLDEVHSYRGAQATEIACLIRRLKAHTGLLNGEILCVGTSATASAGSEGRDRLSRFASSLFGETVHEEDCIGSAFKPQEVDTAAKYVPPPAAVSEEELEDLDSDDPKVIHAMVRRLTGRSINDEGAPPGQNIRAVLRGNAVAQALEQALADPKVIDDVESELRKVRGRQDADRAGLLREAMAYLKVGSFHQGDEDRPRFRPKLHGFFHGAYNITLCADPECREFNPHGDRACRTCKNWAAPVVLCRTCGQEYHKAHYDKDTGALRGTADFFTGKDIVYLTPEIHSEDEEDSNGQDGLPGVDDDDGPRDVKNMDRVDLCIKCAKITRGNSCADCAGRTKPYYMYEGDMHTCPACKDSYRRYEIVSPLRTGAAASTSVLITHHIEIMNDAERKLLVFLDNRQDVAHQAGYTQDKHRKFGLRHWIGHLIRTRTQGKPVFLTDLPSLLLEHYVPTIEPRRLGGSERERWLEALSIQAAMEFTRYTRERGSLETLGLVEIDYDFPANITGYPEFVDLAKRAGVSPDKFLTLVRAMLDIMRQAAAVDYDFFQQPLNPLRVRRLAELQDAPYSVRFPERGYQARAYTFDRTKALIAAGISGFVREEDGRGQYPGIQKLFAEILKWKNEDAADLIRETVQFLSKPEINLLRRPTNFSLPPKARTLSVKLYHVNREMIRLSVPKRIYMCSNCKTVRAYDPGTCPKKRDGTMRPVNLNENNYYVQLYKGRPFRMRVEEHSAQVPETKRKDLETYFKDGKIEVMVASPTMELGVDIGGLNAVVLRGAPPSPANYIQRAGRAARRSGIGFISTLCTGRSHDRHTFEDPGRFVQGYFHPPTIRLDNPYIVHRHMRSFILENMDHPFPAMMVDFLDNYDPPSRMDRDPIRKLCAEVHRKKGDLVKNLSKLFARDRNEGRATGYDGRECEALIDSFENDVNSVFERWWQRVEHLHNEWKTYNRFGSPRYDKKRADAKEKAYFQITKDRERAYTLNYLAEDGLLPSYQFPTDMFALDTGIGEPAVLRRAAHIGIREFAPGNVVYSNGRKLKPIRVLVAGRSPKLSTARERGQLETRYFCKTCDAISVQRKNHCPQCGDEMVEREILRADSFEAMNESRIGSEEESREQKCYDVRTFLVSEESNNYQKFIYRHCVMEVRERTSLITCNFGPTDRKDQAGAGFMLCRECGRYHHNPFPKTKAEEKEMKKWKEQQHDRYCGPAQNPTSPFLDERFSELTLAYQFKANVLLLTPSDASVPKNVEYWHETFVEALILGAVDVLELEPQEIRGLVHNVGRGKKQILIYETTAGGAGYISEIAEKLPEIAAAAFDRLYKHECVQACYSCLLGYHNPHLHDSLDKRVIQSFLQSCMDDRVTERRKPEETVAEKKLEGGGTESQESAYEVGYIEKTLLAAMKQLSNLPEPVAQYEFKNDAGDIVTVADFAYPDKKIAIYCDSLEHHMNRKSLSKDAEKRNWLQSLGWKVLVFWGHVIQEDPKKCAMEILEAVQISA